MNKIVLILLCLAPLILIGQQLNQQHVEPKLIEIPTRTIKYEINNTSRHVTVYSFYMNPLPESLKEYKIYIADILDSDSGDRIEHVYPKSNALRSLGLNEEEVDFILNEYFIEDKYNGYPIIGLEMEQIKNYLNWKSDKIGFKVMKELNINKIDSLSYTENYKIYKDSIDLLVQVDLLIPIESHIISAFEFGNENKVTNNINSKFEEITNPILELLSIKPVQEYNILNRTKGQILNELIKTTPEREEGYNGPSYLISINSDKEGQYAISIEKTILKPWRIWHIKM